MNCHELCKQINIPEGARKIVLAGNPNCGKSVFFNALTGLYVDVSNYPGTTLEISHGFYGQDVIIDTPGVYGVSSFNDEEKVARDVICEADIVVNIINAVHLERDLFLTQQIIDMGIPVVVALNMVDEAERQGIAVNTKLLSNLLGVPVVPTVAVEKKGLDALKATISQARVGHINHQLQAKLNPLLDKVRNQGEALLILEEDPSVEERYGLVMRGEREGIYLARRERVNEIISRVVEESSKNAKLTTLLGRWMVRPITGIPLLLVTLWAMYQIIGVFIAGTVVGVTEGTIMQGLYEPLVRGLVGQVIAEKSILGTILIGEFGLLTMAVTYVLGLLLPLVVGFYLMLSFLEDSGYLPRIAALVDRLLTSIGLNGRAVIPIILGFGCVTLATITTRLLGSERERSIAIFLLGLAIPCSAQFGVIAGLLTKVGPDLFILYAGTILMVLVAVGTMLDKVLPGESTHLLIDLPPVRMPRITNVLTKTVKKSYAFVKEAAPLFALGALLISILQVTGALVALQNFLAPLTVGLLKLPKETATAFIMGLVRRDFGAAGLNSLPLNPVQIVISLIAITLFVPCIATVLVLFKERGWKEGATVWFSSWALAFLIGGTVAHIYSAFIPIGAGAAVILTLLTLSLVWGIIFFLLPKKKTAVILES